MPALPPRSRRARRAVPLALALAALLSLVVALAGCGGDKGSTGDVDPVTLVPASASAYLGVVVHPAGETQAKAERLSQAMFGTDSPGQGILDIAAKATGHSALSFQDDVEPWLGDRVGAAIVPVEGGGSDVVLIAASKDDGKAEKALKDSGRLPQSTSFRGETLYASADGEMAGSVFHGAVVLGSATAVQRVIASVKDDSVLSGAASYTSATGELPKAESVATVYLDISAIAQVVGNLLGGGAIGQLVEPVVSAQGDAIAASVVPEADGLRIDAVGTGTGSGIAAVQAQGGAADAITTLPSDAWLALGISDVGGTVNALLDAAGNAGGLQAVGVTVLLNQIESSLGLTLRGDILSWMGRGGLFVRGTAKGKVSGAIVIQSKDRAAMRRAVRALRKAGGSLPAGAVAGSLGSAGIDDGATLNIGSLHLQVAATGKKLIIAIGPGALQQALHPGQTLGESPEFRAAQAQLGDNLRAGLYVDLPQLGALLARTGKAGALIGEVLGNMSQLVAGGTQDGDTSRVRIFAGVPTG